MTTSPSEVAATGVSGLDDILRGGLPRRRIYLLQGEPGTGKTTLGIQFLLEGRRLGEAGLYVTLSETEEELRAVASSHGWNLDGIALHQLSSIEDMLSAQEQNTLFHPAEVELNETTNTAPPDPPGTHPSAAQRPPLPRPAAPSQRAAFGVPRCPPEQRPYGAAPHSGTDPPLKLPRSGGAVETSFQYSS